MADNRSEQEAWYILLIPLLVVLGILIICGLILRRFFIWMWESHDRTVIFISIVTVVSTLFIGKYFAGEVLRMADYSDDEIIPWVVGGIAALGVIWLLNRVSPYLYQVLEELNPDAADGVSDSPSPQRQRVSAGPHAIAGQGFNAYGEIVDQPRALQNTANEGRRQRRPNKALIKGFDEYGEID